MRRFVILLFLMIISVTHALAVDDPSEMLRDTVQEKRAEAIGAELRCLVCQNESIEESSAPLARDLRRVVRRQVAQGRSNTEVIAWMTARYGEFIRLQPSLSLATALLWATPCLALIGGGFLAFLTMRGRREAPPLSPSERAALDAVMRGQEPRSTSKEGRST